MTPSPPSTAIPPTDPCMVYLDACTLIDLADSTETRHVAATELLNLFQKYQGQGILWVCTSLWAITEFHSVIYKKVLLQNSLSNPPGRRRDPRHTLPPPTSALTDASNIKNQLLIDLQNTTDFLIIPGTNDNLAEINQLTVRFAEEAAIFAPDSFHLAIALNNGDCSIFVTSDGDVLDKIDCCQPSFIIPYRQQQFSLLSSYPSFEGYGVEEIDILIPGQVGTKRRSAKQTLNSLGFV